MRNGRGKFNVPHAFAADFGAGDFNAATVANLPLVTDALVLAAVAFPVACWAENAFAKQTVAFGLERAVVYCFGLFDFAVRPLDNFFGRGQPDSH